MAKSKNAENIGLVISHWLSTRYTVEFMGIWEKVNNPKFNLTEFSNIKNNAGANGFVLSSKQWIERTTIQQMKVLQDVEGRKLLK